MPGQLTLGTWANLTMTRRPKPGASECCDYPKTTTTFSNTCPCFARSIASKDRPGADFLLVYNFLVAPDDYVVFFELTEGKSVIAGSPGQDVAFPTTYAEEAATFLTSLVPAT